MKLFNMIVYNVIKSKYKIYHDTRHTKKRRLSRLNRPRSPLASVSVRETCRAFCCQIVSACLVYQKDLQRCPFSSSCCRDPSVCSWELQFLRTRAISKPAMIALVCHLQILRLLRLPETWEMMASSMRVHRPANNNNKSIISESNNRKGIALNTTTNQNLPFSRRPHRLLAMKRRSLMRYHR
jgi:hypothetical protein